MAKGESIPEELNKIMQIQLFYFCLQLEKE